MVTVVGSPVTVSVPEAATSQRHVECIVQFYIYARFLHSTFSHGHCGARHHVADDLVGPLVAPALVLEKEAILSG